jgi:TolB-like protein
MMMALYYLLSNLMKKTAIIILLIVVTLAQAKEKLAVVDFVENGRLESPKAGAIVANLFGASLSNRYILLERIHVNKIIAEQRFQLSDLVSNRRKITRLGQLLGANRIVIGNVSQLGSTVTVDARVVDVSTGKWSERAYVYCNGLGEIPKNLPVLLSKMNLLGTGGLSQPMPTNVSGPLSYRSQTFSKHLSRGHAKLKVGDLTAAKTMAAAAGKVPGYEKDQNVKFLLQCITQEESRRHDEAVAKGFSIEVNRKIYNSSSPSVLHKYVEGLGKISIVLFMRKNNLYVRIGHKSSRLKIRNPYSSGFRTGVAECDKFKIIANISVCGERVPMKVLYSDGRYRSHDGGRPFTKFRLDAFHIGKIQGIRKDLY